MKIVYLLSWSPKILGGVEKKVAGQIRLWRKEGHEVEVVMLAAHGSNPDIMVPGAHVEWKSSSATGLRKIVQTNKAFARAGKKIKKINPDVVYYRLSYPTPALLRIAKKHRMVIELNNKVTQEMRRNFKVGKLVKLALATYLKFMFSMLAKRASGLVAVTHELSALAPEIGFNCPKQVIPNGIDIDGIASLPIKKSEGGVPVVAFLGSSEHPRGLERLLDLARLSKGSLEFRVFCKNKPTNIPENVTYYGFMEPESYIRVLEECDVGLSTLCLYEKGLVEASSLKIREYLARGLPVIVAHKDTALLENDKSWHLEIGNHERNVEECWQEVVSFCQRMRGKRVPRDEVIHLIDSSTLECMRLSFLEQIKTVRFLAF